MSIAPTFCCVSTPEHLRSFKGRFIWIYTDSGQLELLEERLRFLGKRERIDITFDSIQDMTIGEYPRLAKPVKLEYISIAFGTEPRVLLLTPTRPCTFLTPVWHTNKIVDQWFETLRGRLSQMAPRGLPAPQNGDTT
jgi:hypothetical protein